MAVTLERLNATIADIYAAVGATQGFDLALQRIRTLLNGSSGMLFTPTRDAADGGFGFVDHLNTDLFDQYRTYYWDKDPWGTEAKRKGLWYEGSTGTDELLIAQREFRKHEIYADYLTKLDTVRLCFTVVAGDSDGELPGIHLSIYRGVGSRPFSLDECTALAMLRPHVANALRLACRLQLAEVRASCAWNTLDLMRCGVVHVGDDGIVTFMNASAERLLTDRHGIVAVRHGTGAHKLRCRSSGDDRKLQRLIAGALAPGSRAPSIGGDASFVIRRSAAHDRVLVTVVPLSQHLKDELGSKAHAAILLEALDAPPGSRGASMLKAVYRITPGECRVAEALVAGHRIKTIAARLRIAESTVRTHVRTLYAKTGTHGMSALTSLLTRTLTTTLRD